MKNIIKKYQLLILILLLSASSVAQISGIHYFSDTTNNSLDFVYDYLQVEDGIILTGQHDIEGNQEPIMIKLDLNGDVVWSTISSYLLGTSTNSGFYIEFSDDNFVFAVSYEFFGFGNWKKTIWKINSLNGEVVWTEQHSSNTSLPIRMTDYDSTTFLVVTDVGGISTLLKMDKATGDSIESINFNYLGNSLDIKVDANKNIYYSEDFTVRKFNLDDFNQIIWERTFDISGSNDLFIQQMYIDYLDDLYLFGRNGGVSGQGRGIYIKVDVGTGLEIWSANATSNLSVSLADFKDYNGKIYATFRHTLVGGGNYYFSSSQVDKESGVVDWLKNESVTPLGSPSSHSGNGQAALSIDVDCNGDVYLTGYYGDANFGPEQWGIMKLDGTTGVPKYDLTITIDSLNYDNFSVGLATCLFGNTPVFIGREQDVTASYNVNPLYVKIDQANGDILQRKKIGTGFQMPSQTLDILNYNDSIHVFKQKGRNLVLEQYDGSGSLLWSRNFGNTNLLNGGQMQVNDDYIYITATHDIIDSFVPYNVLETEHIILLRLERNTGNIVNSDTISVGGTVIKMFEIDIGLDTAFFFYENNGNVYFNRWIPGTISSEQFFQTASSNINYSGKLNIVSNYDSQRYVILGSDGIYSINKNSLAISNLMTYSGVRNYHHILDKNDIFYLAGDDLEGTQILTAIDKLTMTYIWDETYSEDGTLYKTITNNTNKLWVSGSNNNIIEIHEIEEQSGKINWTYQTDPTTYGSTIPLDFAMHPNQNNLSVVGIQQTGQNIGNVIIDFLDFGGSNLNTIISQDELGLVSQANTISYLSDSSIWIGGTLNRLNNGKEGFIYMFDPVFLQCEVTVLGDDFAWCSTCEGTAYANVSGGVPPYTYSWSTNDTTTTISGLCVGNYVLTVTDDKGCVTIDSLEINQIGTPMTVSLSSTDASSLTTCDACVTVEKTGGCAPYDLTWNSSGDPTLTYCSACPLETYTVTITDDCGCVVIDSVHTDISSTAGKEKILLQNTIHIFPNPSSEYLIIELTNHSPTLRAIITDIKGTKILTTKLNNKTTVVKTDDFAIGTYLVYIQDGKTIIHTKKWIKQ